MDSRYDEDLETWDELIKAESHGAIDDKKSTNSDQQRVDNTGQILLGSQVKKKKILKSKFKLAH